MTKMWLERFRQHRYGISLVAFLTAAVGTGVVCIGFARAFELVLEHRLDFSSVGHWAWIITPLGFILAVETIRRFAPFASGTGIPQTIFISERLTADNEARLFPMFSPWTISVKIFTLLIGVWVGASTGREGPTVHVAVGAFFFILILLRRLLGLDFDRRSAAIAGGAAGLAAAFNAPLAGVTFAVEELSGNYFSSVKDIVLMAIIIAAVVAKALTGEYTYFGKLQEPTVIPFYAIVLIGIIGGGAGVLFGLLLIKGAAWLERRRGGWLRYVIPGGMALVLLTVVTFAGVRTMGSGNLVAQSLLNGRFDAWSFGYPFAKIGTTLLTYWAGLSGGIFAPCLSVGAALGADVGVLLRLSVPTCALIGMAAFLSGTIQAPMTTFVIIFEMTGHHQMLLPIMLSSLLAYMVARLFNAPNLYKALAEGYAPVLEK